MNMLVREKEMMLAFTFHMNLLGYMLQCVLFKSCQVEESDANDGGDRVKQHEHKKTHADCLWKLYLLGGLEA